MRGRGVGEGAMVEEKERSGIRERDAVGFGRAGDRGRRIIDSNRHFVCCRVVDNICTLQLGVLPFVVV